MAEDIPLLARAQVNQSSPAGSLKLDSTMPTPKPRSSRRGSARKAVDADKIVVKPRMKIPRFQKSLIELWKLLDEYAEDHGLEGRLKKTFNWPRSEERAWPESCEGRTNPHSADRLESWGEEEEVQASNASEEESNPGRGKKDTGKEKFETKLDKGAKRKRFDKNGKKSGKRLRGQRLGLEGDVKRVLEGKFGKQKREARKKMRGSDLIVSGCEAKGSLSQGQRLPDCAATGTCSDEASGLAQLLTAVKMEQQENAEEIRGGEASVQEPGDDDKAGEGTGAAERDAEPASPDCYLGLGLSSLQRDPPQRSDLDVSNHSSSPPLPRSPASAFLPSTPRLCKAPHGDLPQTPRLHAQSSESTPSPCDVAYMGSWLRRSFDTIPGQGTKIARPKAVYADSQSSPLKPLQMQVRQGGGSVAGSDLSDSGAMANCNLSLGTPSSEPPPARALQHSPTWAGSGGSQEESTGAPLGSLVQYRQRLEQLEANRGQPAGTFSVVSPSSLQQPSFPGAFHHYGALLQTHAQAASAVDTPGLVSMESLTVQQQGLLLQQLAFSQQAIHQLSLLAAARSDTPEGVQSAVSAAMGAAPGNQAGACMGFLQGNKGVLSSDKASAAAMLAATRGELSGGMNPWPRAQGADGNPGGAAPESPLLTAVQWGLGLGSAFENSPASTSLYCGLGGVPYAQVGGLFAGTLMPAGMPVTLCQASPSAALPNPLVAPEAL